MKRDTFQTIERERPSKHSTMLTKFQEEIFQGSRRKNPIKCIASLTFINCFNAGLSSRPLRNTRSVSFAPFSRSDKFSLTCWNAAATRENAKRENIMQHDASVHKAANANILMTQKLAASQRTSNERLKKIFPAVLKPTRESKFPKTQFQVQTIDLFKVRANVCLSMACVH